MADVLLLCWRASNNDRSQTQDELTTVKGATVTLSEFFGGLGLLWRGGGAEPVRINNPQGQVVRWR